MPLRWASLKKPRHASDQELLLFLDGELKARQAEQIRAHLDACWECRVRSEETAEVIRNFVEYRRHLTTSGAASPRGDWLNLKNRLQQMQYSEPGARRFRLRAGFAWFSPKVLVLAAFCAIAILWFRFTSAAPV